MINKNTILVPTDFSEVCDNAVNHGCDLAKYFNFKVIVLHVITKETKKFLSEQGQTIDDLHKKMQEYVKEKSVEYGVEVDYLLKEGNIFEQIGQTAKEVNAGLVILGTHGKVGFQRLTGSYALKVINNTNVPTVVVQKKRYTGGYRNIVFPVTPITEDRQKVKLAISIAKAFDSKIHIFPKEENDKIWQKKMKVIIKQITDAFDATGVRYVVANSSEWPGNFAKQVIDYAVVNEADLIMIMTSSEPTLPMFDTWDEQIIFNSSQIPVMCINPARVKKINFASGYSWSGF